jgi:nucleoside 2-deoxyribosyltransferase
MPASRAHGVPLGAAAAAPIRFPSNGDEILFARQRRRDMQIYIASPLGFSEAGRAFYYETLIPQIESLGHGVLDPWKLSDQQKISSVLTMPPGPKKRDEWQVLNAEIGRNNHASIDQCDAVFAVLDGADVDSGTASEIGYGFAKGKPILGYRGDFRLSADNEGAVVNLQVEYFIRQSGGEIITRLADLSSALEKIASFARKHWD